MKRKYPYQLKVYVPVEKEGCVKEFIKICDREGESAAKKLLEFITQYVDRHKNGNPQLLMASFVEGGVPLRKPPLCPHVANFNGTRLYCGNRTMWVTLKHCWRCWNKMHKGR